MAAGGRMTTETRLNKALKDYELMSKEKDVALKEKGEACNERDEVLKDRDKALRERDVALNERDEALKERDKALKENARLGTQLRELQEVVEQERRTATGREANLMGEVTKLSEGGEQLRAQVEGYRQCMEEQKKTLALANENITLLKSQLQSHEEIRRHDQIERDKSEVIIKDLGRRCEALQSERDCLSSERERLLPQCTQVKVLEEEVIRLSQRKEEYRCQLRRASEDHTSRVAIMDEQLKVYRCDFELERAQREKLVASCDVLQRRLNEGRAEKMALQKEINSLAAWLIEYESGGDPSSPYQYEAMWKKMEEEREELISQITTLEAELQRCHKHIREQERVIKEEQMRNQVEAFNRRIAALEERTRGLEGSCAPNGQRQRSNSDLPHAVSQAVPPPPHPPQAVPHPQPCQASPGEGLSCPICGRRDFTAVVELELHSAKCTDFKQR